MTKLLATDWCFTDNQCSSLLTDHYEAMKDRDPSCGESELDIDYMVIGFEEASSGQFHHQGFVQFAAPVSFDDLTEVFKGIHWERRKGTATQAAEYCMKDEAYEEWGTLNAGR